MVKIKRAYEPAGPKDGYRVLVDRLWPRGIKKSKLLMDEWARELAPSAELRKSFGHDPGHWKDFQTKYATELKRAELRRVIELLAKRAKRGVVTLLYSAKDEEHNNAIVLRRAIERKSKAA